MGGVNRVLSASFTATLRNPAVYATGVSAGAQVAAKKAIRWVRYLCDFCLMAQYHSHRSRTMAYMDQYLQKFYGSVQVCSEFRAMKTDRQDTKKASRKLVAGQLEASQAKLAEYFVSSATRRNRLGVEDRLERAYLIQVVLSQGECDLPKVHLLSHHSSQIKKFGSPPQYLTEISQALHKPWKDAYRRSNLMDAADQIVHKFTREHVIRIWGLNIQARSHDV